MHVLYELSEEGHVYYPYELLIEKCTEILEIEESRIPHAIEAIEREGKVVIDDKSLYKKQDDPSDSRVVYLAKFHVSETGIAKRLKRLISTPKQLRLINLEEAINWVQKSLKIEFSEKQKEAIKEAINSKVMIITGGPGTGKTTIIKAIIEIYRAMNQRILLAAPTGRAAKRMTSATGYEAKTIHRLLEFSPSNGSFKRNEKNPLDADIVIIDETSMIDTVLMYHFIKAVKLTTTVIFVGDVDQLPSVGAGNILKDLIDSGKIHTVRLDEIFRQSKESMIIVNAHRINKGEMPYFKFSKDGHQDFFFTEIYEPEEVARYIIYLCTEIIPKRFGFNPVDDVQVITPMYKGIVGVSNLNNELQNVLNKNEQIPIRGGKVFKIGDKVMQLVNNYDKDVYNGDIGKIMAIDREVQEVKVLFEDKIVTYDFSELDEITLAYAISVHKSQGSEYPVVIMPILTHHFIMLQRNLLYTAITRGKRLVFLVGTKRAMAMAVKNNKPLKRYTMLKERLLID